MIPVDDRDLTSRVASAEQRLRELDWKLHDVIVSPVPSFADEPKEHRTDTAIRR